MDSALPGDSLLIEDDFNEFAAAVSEVADGSDDDPRLPGEAYLEVSKRVATGVLVNNTLIFAQSKSDDFLSWLLVHAETVDPKLELDQSEVDTAVKETNDVSLNDFDTPGHVSAEHPPPASFPEHTELPSSRPKREQGEGVSMMAEAGSLTTHRSAAISYPADSSTLQRVSESPSAVSEGTIDGASGGSDGAGNKEGQDGAGLGASGFLGELAVAGGIPSDPVLAMQMGARMALAGKLNMIPFGMTAGAGIGAGTGAPSTQVQPLGHALEPIAALASSAISTPSVPTGTDSAAKAINTIETALPAWTGLPPPAKPWRKVEPAPLPTILGRAENASGSSKTAEALPAIDIEVNGAGAKVDTAGSMAFEDDDLSVGLGEKRPRIPSVSTAEIKAGRDSFKDGRRRKRMSIGELEERVKQVSEDNARLKLHLSSVSDKMKVMAGRKKAMEVEIAAKLEAQRSDPTESNEASLAEVLSRFKDLYADYGAQRRREVQFHLKQLERQIVPTDTTKMSLWTLEQDESFYKDRKRGSLFSILRNELGVSREQIDRIQERRTKIKGLLAELGESLRLVRELQKSSEAKNAKFEEVMARLQSSFSPQQIARLILWVSTNRGRISKLPLLPKHIVEQRGLVKQAP